MKYVCTVCGYVYDEETGDPDNGIAPGTLWKDVPDDFTCPLCAFLFFHENTCAFCLKSGKACDILIRPYFHRAALGALHILLLEGCGRRFIRKRRTIWQKIK